MVITKNQIISTGPKSSLALSNILIEVIKATNIEEIVMIYRPLVNQSQETD